MIEYSTTNIGQIGELIAEKYLLKKRYKILDRNYSLISNITHKKIGEIDLIAKKERTYIFIEVKAKRKSRGVGIPLTSKINQKKKNRLKIMAEFWLKNNKLSLTTERQIDIITIVIDLNNKKALIKHYENAVEDKQY
ncbi:MAG: YraN family protein [Candidatus Paceibacterota bacterium]